MAFIPEFTANISEGWNFTSGSRVSLGSNTSLNDAAIDSNFKNIARYIVHNSSRKVGLEARKAVAAIIVWSGIVVEITGLLNPEGHTRTTDLPLFIRHLKGFYYTGDILRMVEEEGSLDSGLGILSASFVVQKYFNQWLKVPRVNNDITDTLKEAKANYLRSTTDTPSYSGLYKDSEVQSALRSLQDVLDSQNVLNVSLRIRLNKIGKEN